MNQPPALNPIEENDKSFTSLSLVALLLAVLLFIASLFLTAFITDTNDILGYWVLAMGWLGFVAFQFAWYATPLAILSVHISRVSPQLGLVLSVIAILLASQAFLFTEIPFGKNDKVLDYGIGFYLWYMSFYLVAFGMLIQVVAWGSIEEEQPEEERSNNQVPVAVENRAMPGMSSISRKVIRKQTEAGQNQPDVSQSKWGMQTPPPLPKQNTFARKQQKMAKASVPPPLPVNRKKKPAAEQPDLPLSASDQK